MDSGSKALEFLGIEGDGGTMQIHVKVFHLSLSLSLSLSHTHTHTHTHMCAFIDMEALIPKTKVQIYVAILAGKVFV